MKNRKYKKEFNFLIGYIILILITMIFNFIVNNGEKISRMILNILTIIGFYIFYKKFFLKGYRIIYYIVNGFIFISMYLGNIWDFYGVQYFDKYLHLISGFITSIIGYVLYLQLFDRKLRKQFKPITSAVFVTIFSSSMAAVWEIWEFTTDFLFGLSAQSGGLNDTMLDIIFGTIVGLITAILIYINENVKKVKMINNILINESKKGD